MELRKGRKRTLKVREMAEVEKNGACEYLVGPRKQTVAKGQMSRVRKGLWSVNSGNGIDCFVVGVDKEWRVVVGERESPFLIV